MPTDPRTRSARRLSAGLAVALIGGLLLRVTLLLTLDVNSRKTGDTDAYVNMASSLLEGHGFSTDTAPPYRPSNERVPTYPLFIAAAWGLFGKTDAAVLGAQLALDLGVVLLVYGIGRRRFSERVGVIGGAIYALLPFTAATSGQFMSESVAAFCFALALYAHTRAVLGEVSPRGRVGWVALSGVGWGLTVMARPYLAPAVLFAGIVLAVELSSAGVFTRRRAWALGFVGFGFACAMTILPWTARNAYQARVAGMPFAVLQPYGSRAPFTEMYTPEFLAWYRSYDEPMIWLDWWRAPKANYLSEAEEKEVTALFSMIEKNQGKVTPDMSARFAAVTEARYAAAPLRLHVWRPISIALKFWLSPRASSFRFAMSDNSELNVAPKGMIAFFLLLNWTFVALVLIGIVRSRALFLWVVPLAVTITVTLLAHRETRILMPIFPLMCAACGLGLSVLLEWVAARRRRGQAERAASLGRA